MGYERRLFDAEKSTLNNLRLWAREVFLLRKAPAITTVSHTIKDKNEYCLNLTEQFKRMQDPEKERPMLLRLHYSNEF